MNRIWDDHTELKILETKLSERYTEPTYLGGGGFSKIFHLRDRRLDRYCALKVLRVNELDKLAPKERKEVQIRFINEERVCALCRHPNIVEIYDIDRVDDFPYIIMEFIEGISLKKYLTGKGRLVSKDILRIYGAILPAVGYMHDRGVVHRGLKPAVIMIEKGDNDRIVLVDFSIAKILMNSDITQTGYVLGSPHYIAPEQWANSTKVTKKADIYALGVMLFELVAGEVPFKGKLPEIMHAHLSSPVPRVRDKNPLAPAGMQEIIEKAMAKKLEDRYESTGDFLDALRKLFAW